MDQSKKEKSNFPAWDSNQNHFGSDKNLLRSAHSNRSATTTIVIKRVLSFIRNEMRSWNFLIFNYFFLSLADS